MRRGPFHAVETVAPFLRRAEDEAATDGTHAADLRNLPATDLADLIQQLTDQMKSAAAELHFELAARLRDEISELKKELRGMRAAGR